MFLGKGSTPSKCGEWDHHSVKVGYRVFTTFKYDCDCEDWDHQPLIFKNGPVFIIFMGLYMLRFEIDNRRGLLEIIKGLEFM